MLRSTLGTLAAAAGGFLAEGAPELLATRISTDTRTIAAGDLFWALDGPNFRGADFAHEALRKGAMGVVCPLRPQDWPAGVPLILVQDTLAGLGDLARHWRDECGVHMAALSGSSGKTTTREMLAHLCRRHRRTHAMERNLNNLVGLPLTLLRLSPDDEVSVVELGMNRPGELARLTRIANPDVVLLTNIGNAHIGNFGSLDALIAGEAEVLETCDDDTTAVVNIDCPNVRVAVQRHRVPHDVVTFGLNSQADVRAERVEAVKPLGYRFQLVADGRSAPVELRLFGRYQVYNALAAAAGALLLGIDIDDVAAGFASFRPPQMRAETEYLDGIFVIKDCYNASPSAMREALRSSEDVVGPRRRIALLGQMGELGDLSEPYHREMGTAVAEAKFDLMVAFGPEILPAVEEATALGVPVVHFTSHEEMAEFLSRELRQDDFLFVKGSRANQLERALELLRAARAEVRNGTRAPQMEQA
jgi:UDP-N-acetylmuramoyl-tripeptide--D-alanyl-D-alanine ligase